MTDDAGLRVAMVGACPYPVPQGSQVYLRESATALRDAGNDVHLIVYGYGLGEDTSGLPIHRSRNFFVARKTAAGPSVTKPLLDAALVAAIRRVVRRERIDVLGAHNYEGLLAALASRCAPVVYHAHNAMEDELPYYFWFRHPAARLGRWLDETFPKRAHAIVTPHETLAKYLIECGCDEQRITTVPPPLDASGFEQAGITNSLAPPVLYTGNLDAYQNLPFLRAVMERVREEHPDAELLVATASPTKVTWATTVSTPDRVLAIEALNQDAIFVCPRSSWSGYPIKLLNAMAAGLPIVCNERCAYPIKHGIHGLVVADGDVEGFAKAILELMADPHLRTQLGEVARFTALREHDPAVVGRKLNEVYRGVVGD